MTKNKKIRLFPVRYILLKIIYKYKYKLK